QAVDQRQRAVAEDAAAKGVDVDAGRGGGAVGDDVAQQGQVALVVDGAAIGAANAGGSQAVGDGQPGDGGADPGIDEEDLLAVASDDVVVAADAEGGGAGALDGHALGHGQGAAGRDGAAEAGCEHDGIARVRRGQHVGKRPGAAGVEVQDRIHGR